MAMIQEVTLIILPSDEAVNRLGRPDDAVELIKRLLFVLPFRAR